jgi:hypothetical protein
LDLPRLERLFQAISLRRAALHGSARLLYGRNNFWPSSYSPRTKLIYIPALTGCHNVEVDRTKHNAERGWNGGNATSVGRMESNFTAVDPVTQEIRKNAHLPYPNFSGALATAGGLVRRSNGRHGRGL